MDGCQAVLIVNIVSVITLQSSALAEQRSWWPLMLQLEGLVSSLCRYLRLDVSFEYSI